MEEGIDSENPKTEMALATIVPLVLQLMNLTEIIADLIIKSKNINPKNKELLKARIKEARDSVKKWGSDGLQSEIGKNRMDTREELAEYAHEAWAEWIKYMFEKSTENRDGTITVPAWAVERWKRQATTIYAELPEIEKEGDRQEADRMIALIKKEVSP